MYGRKDEFYSYPDYFNYLSRTIKPPMLLGITMASIAKLMAKTYGVNARVPILEPDRAFIREGYIGGRVQNRKREYKHCYFNIVGFIAKWNWEGFYVNDMRLYQYYRNCAKISGYTDPNISSKWNNSFYDPKKRWTFLYSYNMCTKERFTLNFIHLPSCSHTFSVDQGLINEDVTSLYPASMVNYTIYKIYKTNLLQ